MNDGVTEGLVATATSLMQHTHQDRCSVKLAGWKSHACLSMHMVMRGIIKHRWPAVM